MGLIRLIWPLDLLLFSMAVVAQLVEPRIVIPVVAGSSPVNRPIFHFQVSQCLSVSRRFFSNLYSSILKGLHQW